MRRFTAIILLLGIGLFSGSAGAYDLARQVEGFTLDNGMRWLVVRRPQAPVFSGVIMVRVGGADEAAGKSGLAHMFEHMAFKGSSRLGTRDFSAEKPILKAIEFFGEEIAVEETKPHPNRERVRALKQRLAELERRAAQYRIPNEIWEVMSRNGAKGLNAYTSKDVTTYYASMPATRLELWARVLREMIFDPAFREFYTEREVIQQERRMGVENDPDGALSETLLKAAYRDGPYHESVIGPQEEIQSLTIGDARAFHAKHYVPANMVGVLVGDISVRQAKRVMRRVFGSLPKAPRPPAPESSGTQRRGVHEHLRFAAEPALAIAYHKPTLPDATEYTFDVIDALLCDGRTSRLQKRLVYEERLAKDIYCSDGYPGSRLDNLFLIWIEPLAPHAPARVARAVEEEIARLRTEPVPAAELEKVRRRVMAAMVLYLDDNMALAQALARFQTIFGDWRLLAQYPEHIAEVTAEEVQRVAKQYLQSGDRIVVERTR